MVWTPPTKPAPGIATPTEVVAQAQEMGGAAYRTQKQAWVAQIDTQKPYYEGFVQAKNAYMQPDINISHEEVGVHGPTPPPDKAPVGSRRPRSSTGGDLGGGTSHRTNVLSNKETTGEAPAPLFTMGQATGRRP